MAKEEFDPILSSTYGASIRMPNLGFHRACPRELVVRKCCDAGRVNIVFPTINGIKVHDFPIISGSYAEIGNFLSIYLMRSYLC